MPVTNMLKREFFQNSLASASCAAEEKMSNIRTVKAFSNEVREIEYYEKMLHHALNLQNKEALAKGVFFGLVSFFHKKKN